MSGKEPETPSFASQTTCISQLPAQRERIVKNQGATFSMIIVGESGLGKSTFIRTLLGSEFTSQRSRPSGSMAGSMAGSMGFLAGHTAGHTTSSTVSHTAFATGPTDALSALSTQEPANEEIGAEPVRRSDVHSTAEVEVHHAVVSENGFDTNLTVIDTPRFGDYADNTNTWVPVVSYIVAQHQHYMCQEEQPDRSQLLDTRVHVCIYFLAPTNRVLELDLVAMRELSRCVNLVPVIAKGDSLTPEDLAAFKHYVRDVLAEHGVEVWTPPAESAAAWSQAWPCAIVASDEFIVLPSGKRTRGRTYRWGVVDVCNPDHSDFVLLRDLLIGRHMLDLIDATAEVHYSRQRRNLRLLRLRRALNLDTHEPGLESKADNGAAGTTEFGAAEFGATGSDFSGLSPAKRSSSKLLPSDRPSLAFMSSALRATGPAEEPNAALDVAKEALQAMPALDLLVAISRYGQKYLNAERHEHDVLLRQRALALKAQFDVVVKFQEERFDAQVAELEKTRDQLSQEVAGLNDFNEQLMAEIRGLELSR